MELKEMTLADLDTIQNDLSNFDDFWTVGTLKNELCNPNCHYIVAIDNSEIIGFGGIHNVLDESTINFIAVRKDRRHEHVGSKILEKLIELSKSLNSSFLTLEVNIKNTNAIKLYEKFGFKNLGIRKNYYYGNTDGYIMTLYFHK